jgi:hypothetical protein
MWLSLMNCVTLLSSACSCMTTIVLPLSASTSVRLLLCSFRLICLKRCSCCLCCLLVVLCLDIVFLRVFAAKHRMASCWFSYIRFIAFSVSNINSFMFF